MQALSDAPAPWALHASSYILVLRLPRARLDADCFMTPELQAARSGRFAYAMFVDYDRSPVGPYRELLFIPGAFRYDRRTCFTISKIFVSSTASVDNGRRNWGIPKELAEFEVEYGTDRVDRVRMRTSGRQAVALTLRHYPVGIPLLGSLVPPSMRTLCHTLEGRRFTLAPTARGPMRAAKLLQAEIDPDVFPAFAPEHVLAAVKLPSVELLFPPAQVAPA